jgi:signal transduction histidine kinase
LRTLFENLLRNAVEHTDPPLTIRVGTLDPGKDDTGGFFVEDTGTGIPPETRDQMLEHGYSTREDGTGFGLSIAQEIVEAHGWQIQIRASEERGARFEITGVSFATATVSE